MGMNVHLYFTGEHRPIPKELGCENSHSLPRYSGGSKFMSAVWEGENKWLKLCNCGDIHQYMCPAETHCRPINFDLLRERTKELQPIWQTLIDYLEEEPNAYIDYD